MRVILRLKFGTCAFSADYSKSNENCEAENFLQIYLKFLTIYKSFCSINSEMVIQ